MSGFLSTPISSRCFRHPRLLLRRHSSTGLSAWMAKGGFFGSRNRTGNSPDRSQGGNGEGRSLLKGRLAGLIVDYCDKILGLDADTAAVSGRLEASAAPADTLPNGGHSHRRHRARMNSRKNPYYFCLPAHPVKSGAAPGLRVQFSQERRPEPQTFRKSVPPCDRS